MILLSARAGEESRVEGLQAGADDYLVKPFSARELLARVGARLEMARVPPRSRGAGAHLMESISDGFIALDRDWRYTTVNDRACEIMGMNRDEDMWAGASGNSTRTGRPSRWSGLRRAVVDQECRCSRLYPSRDRWYENRLYPTADGLTIFFAEVTERRRTEEAMRESEARFRNMADNAPVGIWVTDPSGRCTYVNEWWCRFTGTSPEQSLGFGWLESVHPDDRRQAEATFLGGRTTPTGCSGGVPRAGARRGLPPGDRLGGAAAGAVREYLGYIGSVIDVTEERRREEALRRSEEMLAEAQQIAHIGSWSWDLESNEITWSDEHYRIVGLRPQEIPMTAERAASYIHWEDRAIAWESVRRAIRDRQPYEWCLRMVREDGTVIIAQSRGRTVYDEAGKPVWMFGTIQDVTERIRAEEALQRDAMVLANVSDSVIATDLEGIITFWNEGATRLFGWTAAEMVGRPYADRFPEPERSWIVEQVRSRAAGTEWVGEYQDYRDGTRVWIDAHVRRVTDAAGRPHGIIGIARDITERKRDGAEEQLAADLAGMRRLQEVSTQLYATATRPRCCEIMDAAIAITAADMGTVQLLDADSGTLRLVASRGFGRAT